MAIPIIMPRQGQSVETCIITQWYKKKGDRVEVGDLLFSYETDKASFEEEAKDAGTLLDIFFGENDDVPVLTTVAVLGEPGENYSELAPAGRAPAPDTTTNAPSDVKEEQDLPTTSTRPTPTPTDGRIKISPRAKNLAAKHNLDTSFAVPTGPEGRVIQRDIHTLMESGPKFTSAAKAVAREHHGKLSGTGVGGRITTADLQQTKAATEPQIPVDTHMVPTKIEYQDQPLTNIRKRIAEAMHQSLISTAQITLNAHFDATAILCYRQLLKAKQEEAGLENITLNHLIIYATARTLTRYPELNAHLSEETLRLFTHVHMGVAVDTDRGLMVPTLFNADLKSLNQISQDAQRLATQAQSGAINPDELQGGTFTITNLGPLGVNSFTPILNPPQTGILGIGGIEYKIKPAGNEYVNYPAMALSLTFDHRAIDGAPAARFLQELVGNLENFTLLLAK